jgi:hypothetical protein
MAYDAARRVVVLFGGVGVDGAFDNPWEYDGTTWSEVATSAVPDPTRSDFSMTYDSIRRVVVFWGGEWCTFDPHGSSCDQPTDTWEYDGRTWNRVTTAVSPSGRSGHAMAYDVLRGVVVLFGGGDFYGTNPNAQSETWEYDGTTWTQVATPVTPPGRSRHAMTYDSTRGVVVLFGGDVEGGHGSETWEYDGTTWALVTTSVAPPARSGHAMAYDSTREAVVLFGGGFPSTWMYYGP